MRFVILSTVACAALPYFSTLSHKRHDFGGGELLNTKCVFWFSLQLFPKYFSFQEEVSEMWLKMRIGFHVKYPLFLSYFNENWIFSKYFREVFKYQISWKSGQWEPNYSRRTGHDEANTGVLISPLSDQEGNKLQRPNSNFCNPLKKKIRKMSVQTGLRGSNDLRVGRKMANFKIFLVGLG